MLGSKATLDSVPDSKLEGARVLMRVDFNVPLTKSGEVSDKTRILATLPTIERVLSKKPKALILMSHLGRPDGEAKPEFSLKPIVPLLSSLLNRPVTFLSDCVGEATVAACRDASAGSVILLENLRFHIEEEGSGVINGEKVKADKAAVSSFRLCLTSLGDIYVNDAFGTAHRGHSSMVGIDLGVKVAGLLMQKELEYFSKALENPQRPLLAILGGAKVRDKIQLIHSMLDKVDILLIGGGMAYTFLKVLSSIDIGNSLFDEEGSRIVPEIMKKAAEKGVKILLPSDWLCADKFDKDATIKLASMDTGIPAGWMGLDIGCESIKKFAETIANAKTILWNGPLGVFEFPRFANGSLGILDAVIAATQNGAVSIVGGGDTAAMVEGSGKASAVSHVSTGGGASLELLEGKQLPGVLALSNKADW